MSRYIAVASFVTGRPFLSRSLLPTSLKFGTKKDRARRHQGQGQGRFDHDCDCDRDLRIKKSPHRRHGGGAKREMMNPTQERHVVGYKVARADPQEVRKKSNRNKNISFS